jgi:hypothetical protein
MTDLKVICCINLVINFIEIPDINCPSLKKAMLFVNKRSLNLDSAAVKHIVKASENGSLSGLPYLTIFQMDELGYYYYQTIHNMFYVYLALVNCHAL